MENKKMISVIVPVYNAESRLELCIESIINQKLTEFELILVDDGSTDLSGNICDKYKETDQRVKVIHKENGGVSSARNAGIDRAVGEYIAFIDSDDTISPYYLMRLRECLENGADVAICDVNYEGRINDEKRIEDDEIIDVSSFLQKYFRVYKTAHMIGAPFAKMFVREILQNFDYENNESYAEDFVYNLKAYMNCKRFGMINEKLYNYYEGDINSLSKKNVKKLDYMYRRQKRVIMPLVSKLTIQYDRSIEIEFLEYFIIRDACIVYLENSYSQERYVYFKKMFADQELYEIKKNKDYVAIKNINTIGRLLFNMYVRIPSNSLGIFFLYVYMNIIVNFAKTKGKLLK